MFTTAENENQRQAEDMSDNHLPSLVGERPVLSDTEMPEIIGTKVIIPTKEEAADIVEGKVTVSLPDENIDDIDPNSLEGFIR